MVGAANFVPVRHSRNMHRLGTGAGCLSIFVSPFADMLCRLGVRLLVP